MSRITAEQRKALEHTVREAYMEVFPTKTIESRLGDYATAWSLLQDIAEHEHNFTEIGVAAHPEGHPAVGEEVLTDALLRKQVIANYLVTQMCFDAAVIGNWLIRIRDRGVTLPAWVGVPGVADRTSLIKTSMRIGVGDSLRYLKRNARAAMKFMLTNEYRPDELLFDLAPHVANPEYNIQGHHIYCFNQVEKTENWRHEFLAGLN